MLPGLRPAVGFFWVLGSLFLAVGVWAGARAMPGLAPWKLESLQVEGAERTRPAAVAEAAGLRQGMGLLSIDVGEVRGRVERLPWVRAARVVRRIPSSLTVAVEEWQPRYLVRLDRLYYLTPEGHVVIAPLDQGLDFPVVTGLTRADLERPTEMRDSLLECLREADRSLPPGEVSEIHADPVAGLTVYTNAGPGQGIYLGFGDWEAKFSRLGRLQRHLERHNRIARSVNLVPEDKIIARLLPVAEEEPTP